MKADSSTGEFAGERARDAAAGELLRTRAPARLAIAFALTVLQGVLTRTTVAPVALATATSGMAIGLALYAAILALVALRASYRGATPTLVTIMLGADLGFVFLLTAMSASPSYYERALFGTVALVHVANFSFGRRQAWRVAALGVAGYLGLIVFAVRRGLIVQVPDQLWSLALFAAAVAFIIVQAADVRRRLRVLVSLFERAGEGDFSHAYDDVADRRPDAITRVGRAYNRVRSQLSDMVLTDPLTGCLNRRGFDQAVAREVARTSRTSGEFALLALDLDHFKQVNDTWGHIAGDQVLRSIGSLLQRAGRAGDVVARVGGEEFAVLLSDTGSGGALLFASRLCDMIRRHEFVISGREEPIHVTTSVGVVAGSPRGSDDFAATLWSQADAALYAAKRAGRDCVRQPDGDTPVHQVVLERITPTRFPGFLTM